MNIIARGIIIIVACLSLSAAGWTGWTTGRAPLLTQLAQQDAAYNTEKFQAQVLAAQALKVAQDRGDALTNTLAIRQSEIVQLTREKRNAISQVTTGRACLDSAALRLLNTAPGLSVSGIPQTTGSVVAAGAAAATDTDIAGVVSTDADIASWAIDAGSQYEVCRARLDALIDWSFKL